MPRPEARRIYDGLVSKVRDPALLEFAGYNLIRSSVFPVPPGGEQKVRITYEHLLAADGDRVDYVHQDGLQRTLGANDRQYVVYSAAPGTLLAAAGLGTVAAGGAVR